MKDLIKKMSYKTIKPPKIGSFTSTNHHNYVSEKQKSKHIYWFLKYIKLNP